MAYFRYSAEIIDRFATIRGGVIYATGLTNTSTPPGLLESFEAEQETVRQRLGDTPPSEIASLAAWRRTFSAFGVKPTQYRNAAEALLRRLSKQGTIPSINTLVDMLRPESWTIPAGGSPVRVIAGEPGSRPRFVAVRRRAERGVESHFGGSKRAGRSAFWCESCSSDRETMREPSRSFHGEGHVRRFGVPDMPTVGSFRGTRSGTYARDGLEQERPVCAALSAETAGISRW